jgi:hypothetical protein
MNRAVCRAMDPQTTGIVHANGYVFNNDDEIGILLKHTVRASFKQDIYDVQVAFTSKGIVSCECSCKAGSWRHECVLCVHILPIILQFTTLLYDGLAEHILYEVANDWYYQSSSAFSNVIPSVDPKVLYDSSVSHLSSQSQSTKRNQPMC